ncbi:hypothetical protein CFP56_019763 [Quercus suber]|uniref:Uncharacterized protein n=1 Tax=Quercus suber TaxID=58331 RepID=A0AAW0LZW0_QUESU
MVDVKVEEGVILAVMIYPRFVAEEPGKSQVSLDSWIWDDSAQYVWCDETPLQYLGCVVCFSYAPGSYEAKKKELGIEREQRQKANSSAYGNSDMMASGGGVHGGSMVDDRSSGINAPTNEEDVIDVHMQGLQQVKDPE